MIDATPPGSLDTAVITGDVCMQHTGRKVSITDLLPPERECCGTLDGSHHRATCAKYSGKFKPANAELCGGPSGLSERAPGYASAPKTEE